MNEKTEIILTGDLGSELGRMVAKEIHEYRPDLNIHPVMQVEEAYAIPLEDLLATAAAIAAVLDFLVNLTAFWLDRKDKQKAELRTRAELGKLFKKYGADGFELEALELIDSKTKAQELQRVVIKDLPNHVLLEVERKSASEYKITRKPLHPKK